jgi:hypothetical protein
MVKVGITLIRWQVMTKSMSCQIGVLCSGNRQITIYSRPEFKINLKNFSLGFLACHRPLVYSAQSGLGKFYLEIYSKFISFHFQSRTSVGVPMLLVAWSITEVIRYSFYALNLLNAVPWVLTWMR